MIYVTLGVVVALGLLGVGRALISYLWPSGLVALGLLGVGRLVLILWPSVSSRAASRGCSVMMPSLS